MKKRRGHFFNPPNGSFGLLFGRFQSELTKLNRLDGGSGKWVARVIFVHHPETLAFAVARISTVPLAIQTISAVIAEILTTHGFTNLNPFIGVILFFAICFHTLFFSLTRTSDTAHIHSK